MIKIQKKRLAAKNSSNFSENLFLYKVFHPKNLQKLIKNIQ